MPVPTHRPKAVNLLKTSGGTGFSYLSPTAGARRSKSVSMVTMAEAPSCRARARYAQSYTS